MQRIKHKEVSECKWKNCDNCQQAHHALLCDKPRGSQAIMKASYETQDGDDKDNADGDDDSYFTMKDGDHFYATGQDESNENQGGADGDGHRYDGPTEEMENGL